MAIERHAVPRDRNRGAATGGNAGPVEKRPQGFATGATGRSKSEAARAAVTQEQEARGQGLDLAQINRYRFRLREGEEADVIILDASLDDVLFAPEHQMWDQAAKENVFEFCPAEYAQCVLCDGVDRNRPSYTMFLTLLDLRGYTKRDGTVEPHVKRLIAIKNNLHPEFFRLHDEAVKAHGTMRGMYLLMARDGETSNATGHPIALPDGNMFTIYSEDTLVQEFGHAEVRNEEGQLVKSENFDITPYAYQRIFRQPTGEDLRRKFGGAAPAGSREDVGGSWNGVRQRMDNDAAAGEARPRTRSALPSPEANEGPVAPGALPARTRSRAAPAAAQAPTPEAPAPVAPGAAPRTRSRPAPAATGGATNAVAGIVRRAKAGSVPNDQDAAEPF